MTGNVDIWGFSVMKALLPVVKLVAVFVFARIMFLCLM